MTNLVFLKDSDRNIPAWIIPLLENVVIFIIFFDLFSNILLQSSFKQMFFRYWFFFPYPFNLNELQYHQPTPENWMKVSIYAQFPKLRYTLRCKAFLQQTIRKFGNLYCLLVMLVLVSDQVQFISLWFFIIQYTERVLKLAQKRFKLKKVIKFPFALEIFIHTLISL